MAKIVNSQKVVVSNKSLVTNFRKQTYIIQEVKISTKYLKEERNNLYCKLTNFKFKFKFKIF